jgi:hypothetical protein
MSGRRLRKLARVECFGTLYHVDNEVVLGVWSSASCGTGGLTSSSLERSVFAPPIALMASSLRLWMEVDHLGRVVFGLGPGCVRVGFAPVVSVLAQFSVN